MYARKLAQLADTRRHMRRGCGTLTYRRNRKKSRKAPVVREMQVSRHRQLFLVFLFSVSQFFFLQSSMFVVRDVAVQGQSSVKEASIRKAMDVRAESRYWEISPESMRQDILALHVIEDARVDMLFPDRLDVTVTERKPLYTVAAKKQPKETYTVDRSGVVLDQGKAGPESLKILLDRSPRVGGRISSDELEISNFFQEHMSQALKARLVSVDFDRRDEVTLRVKYRDGTIPVRLGRGEKLGFKLFLLEELLASLKAESAQVLSIDLRFSTPIVKKPYQKPSSQEQALAE